MRRIAECSLIGQTRLGLVHRDRARVDADRVVDGARPDACVDTPHAQVDGPGRALISAVGSARALHYVQRGLSLTDTPDKANDAFLGVLDKYTSAGIYMVHSTFSLIELFLLSGLTLSSSITGSAFAAAEESVRLIDGVFGSNESSRALAAIVLMVRRELTADPRFKPGQHGIVATLTSLTKVRSS